MYTELQLKIVPVTLPSEYSGKVGDERKLGLWSNQNQHDFFSQQASGTWISLNHESTEAPPASNMKPAGFI